MTDRSHIEPAIERVLDARRGRLRQGRPYAPKPLDDVLSGLEALLRARLAGEFSVQGLQPLTGGASKQHFVFDLVRPGAPGDRRTLVLRTALGECLGTPPNFQRESEIQRALRGIVPVADEDS